MGATLTAAWIDGSKLSIAHVGDSRAYLLRRPARCSKLTSDHSLVAEQVRKGILTAVEAEESQMQSVLLRALGSQAEVEVDAEEYMVIARIFCCSVLMGLTRMVIDRKLRDIAVRAGCYQGRAKAGGPGRTIRGGSDNITVIVVRIGAESKGWFFNGCAQGRGNMRPQRTAEKVYGEAKPDVRKPIGEGSSDRESRGGHRALPGQRLAGRQSGGLQPSRPRFFRGWSAGG